jgi:hypothetical protein
MQVDSGRQSVRRAQAQQDKTALPRKMLDRVSNQRIDLSVDELVSDPGTRAFATQERLDTFDEVPGPE